jgi:hypothetical protein
LVVRWCGAAVVAVAAPVYFNLNAGGTALVGCNPGIHDVLSVGFANFLLLW